MQLGIIWMWAQQSHDQLQSTCETLDEKINAAVKQYLACLEFMEPGVTESNEVVSCLPGALLLSKLNSLCDGFSELFAGLVQCGV